MTTEDGTESSNTRRKEQLLALIFVSSLSILQDGRWCLSVVFIPASVLYLYQLVQVFSAILQEANSVVCLSQLHLCRYLCGLAVDPCGMVASLCTTTVISASSVTSPAARYVHRLTFQWRLVNTARRMAFSFTTNGVLCVDCL